MHRSARALWGLAAVGGATAVGITTHDAGFTILTLLGGMALPRILGLPGASGHRAAGCWGAGRGGRLQDRLTSWHRHEHGDTPSTGAPTGTAQA